MAKTFQSWFQSGFNPAQFPSVPGPDAQRSAFLDELVSALWALDPQRIEKVLPLMPGLLKGKVPGDEIIEAIERNVPDKAPPLSRVLMGELVLDFLILGEQWEKCLPRIDALLQTVHREGWADEAAILYNYKGVCLLRLARYGEARDALMEGLAFAEHAENNRQRARVLINLGLVYKEMGQLEEAARHYKEALKCAREEKDNRTVLACYLNIGNIYRELGRWSDGRKALEEGIRLAREIGEDREELRGRLNLGVLLLEEARDLESAASLFREVISRASEAGSEEMRLIARSNLALALVRLGKFHEALDESWRSLNEAQRRKDHEGIWRAHDNTARACAGLGRLTEAERHFREAFTEFEKLKSQLKTVQQRVDFHRKLQDLHADFVEFSLANRGPETAFSRLALSKGRELLLGNLGAAAVPGEDDAEVVRRIRSGLSRVPGSLVLDYFLHRGRLRVFSCDENEVAVHEPPEPSALLPEWLSEVHSEIALFVASREYRDAQRNRAVSAPDALVKLGRMLLGAVSDSLRACRELFVVPSWIVNDVPFQALVHGTKYLVETHPVSVLPSSAFLLRGPAENIGELRKVVVLRGEESDLSGVQAELGVLRRLFGDRIVSLDSDSLDFSMYQSFLSDADLVHFAGHAEFDSRDPYASALILAGGRRLPLSDFVQIKLDLRRTRLVSLVGCETGKGAAGPGEEVISIGRGFLGAGAQAVLASLWKVSDEMVPPFVEAFYESLLKRGRPAHALRDAALHMLRESRVHPYFFAAFQLYGLG